MISITIFSILFIVKLWKRNFVILDAWRETKIDIKKIKKYFVKKICL